MVQGAAMATVTHKQIYTEVRAYLLGLFLCPPESVIQGYQNDAPLPDQAIVMSILFEQALDVSADFYGADSGDKARKLCNLWKSHYTTARLVSCQPLYCKDPVQMTFINEQSRYEQRWMVELLLQYNPEFSHEQTYLDMPVITLKNL